MALKLSIIEGPDKDLQFQLTGKKECVIGRDPKSCQFLVSDNKVSRRHASIREDNGHYYLTNLSKTNPIFVNDQEINEEVELQVGQKIKLGTTVLEFKEVKEEETKKEDKFDNLFEDLDEESPASYMAGEPDKPEEPKSPKEDEKNESESKQDHFDTIFQDLGDQDALDDFASHMMGPERFILKVLAGPNTGAEFALKLGKSYIIGTDVTGADIILNDLSVSRHHARLSLTEAGELLIEDLNSRNGVVIDGEQVQGQRAIGSQNLITLGTTTFVIVDRESGEKTIAPPTPKPKIEEPKEELDEKVEEEPKEVEPKKIKESTFMLTGILMAIIIVLGVGALMLFRTAPVDKPSYDYTKEIHEAIGKDFPDVKFSYNPNTGTLFLVGHVLTTVDKEELMYNLSGLNYVSQIDDNVVTDELVYQEMNQILARNPEWRGVNIHAPTAGNFVITGYLPTREDGALLTDFVNVQFPYVDRLSNYVVIEEDLRQDILSKLQNYGFYNVGVDLANGEVTFTGYVNQVYDSAFEKVLKEVCRINGVRTINNYVVVVGKNQDGKSAHTDPSIINLTKYPGTDISGTYAVTGYAIQGDCGRAVEINSSIYTVGDQLDGMKVIDITNNTVILEKHNLKYKIEFNR